QDVEFRFGLDIEKENSLAARLAPSSPSCTRGQRILQRRANLLARFANARKHNPLTAYAEMAQMFQLAAGNDIKPASQLCKILQDRQISVGLHGKTDCVWSLA